jgi:hypothetical protein
MSDDERYSTDAARAAAARGDLGEWVTQFLCSPGSDNCDLARQLSGEVRAWIGPVQLPLDRLHRLAGPPGAPVLQPVDEEFWRDDVDDLARRIARGFEPPPVIVALRGDQLVLEDGNHRVEALRRAGRDQTWSVVGFGSPDARNRFIERVDSDRT